MSSLRDLAEGCVGNTVFQEWQRNLQELQRQQLEREQRQQLERERREELERERREELERAQRHHTELGGYVDTGSTSTRSQPSGVNAQRNVWWLPAWLPLSDQATSLFLSKVTDTAVMGLVTLATFSATYLLAWGKPGTCCMPSTKNSAGKDLKNPGPSWPQIIAALLPFAVFPIALYFSAVAKQAEADKRVLSSVAGTCLCEFILPIALGAWMSYCMAGDMSYAVLGVTAFLILVTAVAWGLTFKYPKCLRYFIWTICFRQAELKAHGS